jgi:hypothetical protein
MVPPFSPFLVAILEAYGIKVIHLHPKFVVLLAVFAYAYEAWIGMKPSMAYFCHLFALRSSGQNQSSGCVSFIATTETEEDFIDMKWVKKVEDFRSHWIFVDILKDSRHFSILEEPPAKQTSWASEALPEVVLNALHPRIQDLRREGITRPMVGVEFVTKRIAPLQNNRRPIWSYMDGDRMRRRVSELPADARGEVVRAFLSIMNM